MCGGRLNSGRSAGVSPAKPLRLRFIAIDAISLINPEGIYEQLLRPSLIALFTAQAIVFLVYPLYRRAIDRRGWIPPTIVAALAPALMIYGLYHAIVDRLAT